MEQETTAPKSSKWNYIVGIVLILGAVALYINDARTGKTQAASAAMVQKYASEPVFMMGLQLDSAGAASNAFWAAPGYVITNILAHLQTVQPASFPKGTVEGDEYMMYMLFTNKTHGLIRAARLYDEPDDLYVGVKVPVKVDDNNNVVQWDFMPPAKVEGLGKIFKDLADAHIDELRASAENFQPAFSNMLESASKNPDGSIDFGAWLNATNTPATAEEE